MSFKFDMKFYEILIFQKYTNKFHVCFPVDRDRHASLRSPASLRLTHVSRECEFICSSSLTFFPCLSLSHTDLEPGIVVGCNQWLCDSGGRRAGRGDRGTEVITD